MTTEHKLTIKIGDTVTFDNNQIEKFKAETSSNEKTVRQYQQMVLGGINQVGTVMAVNINLITVAYPDGWELPVPAKYLLVLPKT